MYACNVLGQSVGKDTFSIGDASRFDWSRGRFPKNYHGWNLIPTVEVVSLVKVSSQGEGDEAHRLID
jgi:hypothetical protein